MKDGQGLRDSQAFRIVDDGRVGTLLVVFREGRFIRAPNTAYGRLTCAVGENFDRAMKKKMLPSLVMAWCVDRRRERFGSTCGTTY